MSSFVYNSWKEYAMRGTGATDVVNGVVKVLLVDSTHVSSADTDVFVSDCDTLGELSGTGYTGGFAGSGRKTLANKTVTKDTANDRAVFDADDLTWSAINAGTAAAAIVYLHLTSDAASRLIAYIDSGGFPIVTNGGDVTLSWSASGICTLT